MESSDWLTIVHGSPGVGDDWHIWVGHAGPHYTDIRLTQATIWHEWEEAVIRTRVMEWGNCLTNFQKILRKNRFNRFDTSKKNDLTESGCNDEMKIWPPVKTSLDLKCFTTFFLPPPPPILISVSPGGSKDISIGRIFSLSHLKSAKTMSCCLTMTRCPEIVIDQ